MKKMTTRRFPFVHHPFVVKCGYSKHNIAVITHDSLTEVSFPIDKLS